MPHIAAQPKTDNNGGEPQADDSDGEEPPVEDGEEARVDSGDFEDLPPADSDGEGDPA